MGKTLLKEMSRRVINNESQVNRNKTGTFASQHIRPCLLSNDQVPPTSAASKINKFVMLAACLLEPEILQNGIGNKNFVQIKMYVTSHRCVLLRIAVIAN